MLAVLLLPDQAAFPMWVDPLTNWYRDIKADTGVIIHSTFVSGGGGVLCYNFSLLFQNKKNSNHAAPHSHAQTHVSTIKETHSLLPQ